MGTTNSTSTSQPLEKTDVVDKEDWTMIAPTEEVKPLEEEEEEQTIPIQPTVISVTEQVTVDIPSPIVEDKVVPVVEEIVPLVMHTGIQVQESSLVKKEPIMWCFSDHPTLFQSAFFEEAAKESNSVILEIKSPSEPYAKKIAKKAHRRSRQLVARSNRDTKVTLDQGVPAALTAVNRRSYCYVPKRTGDGCFNLCRIL